MDSEESSVNELLGRAQSFYFSNTGTQAQQQPPPVVPQTPHLGARADKLFTNVDPPMMNVVPAAPIQAPEELASFGRNLSRVSVPQPSTPPPSSPIPMAISPTASLTQIGSSRRRVAFGPRANCDKCRLGAPGHFTHYE